MPAVEELIEQIARQAKKAIKTDGVSKATRKALAAQEEIANKVGNSVTARAQALLEEYKDSQGKIDTVVDRGVGPTFIEEAELKSTRDAFLFSPESTPDYSFQTSSREEFKARLDKQLTDVEFSSRAILRRLSEDLILEARQEENTFQRFASRAFRTSNRSKARVTEWLGDSPYGNRIMIHMDRQSDPLRGNTNLDPIQFDFPREMGFHSGTMRAARMATLRSVDQAQFQMDAFTKMVSELEGAINISPGGLGKQIARALEQHFIRKFSIVDKKGIGKGRITDEEMVAMWDEVRNNVIFNAKENSNVLTEKAVGELHKIIARGRQLPLADSTPHLFRGKNGIYLKDDGGWGPGQVWSQLFDIYDGKADRVVLNQIINNGTTLEKQKGLQKFIEDKGFDHIIYHNSVEDKGSLSIINWNPDLWISIYDDTIQGSNNAARASAFGAFVVGAMGFGDEGA